MLAWAVRTLNSFTDQSRTRIRSEVVGCCVFENKFQVFWRAVLQIVCRKMFVKHKVVF